jgi:hypothetical protein
MKSKYLTSERCGTMAENCRKFPTCKTLSVEKIGEFLRSARFTCSKLELCWWDSLASDRLEGPAGATLANKSFLYESQSVSWNGASIGLGQLGSWEPSSSTSSFYKQSRPDGLQTCI